MALKILLTGASGYLGSALALRWVQAGYDVSLLLRPTSQLERLRGFETSFNICRFTSDVEIEAFIDETQPEIVVHTAGAYGRKGETSLHQLDTNIRFGVVIFQSLQRITRPVTFLNTGSALPPNVSYYSLSKHQFAQWGRMCADQSNGHVRFINVLLQHIYGPGDDLSKFTTHVLRACQRNDRVLDLTLGDQARDFLYIDDAVLAYDTLLAHRDKLEVISDIDVGSGDATTIRQYCELVHRLTGSHTELLFGALPYRANEPMHCQANIKKIKQLGWEPTYKLQEGLLKTIEIESLTWIDY